MGGGGESETKFGCFIGGTASRFAEGIELDRKFHNEAPRTAATRISVSADPIGANSNDNTGRLPEEGSAGKRVRAIQGDMEDMRE